MGSNATTRTKKDLIECVAETTRQSRSTTRLIIQAALDQIVNELALGNRLEFRQFGVFEVRERAARIAQNPKTLQPVMVPARRSVKFKPGRSMRDRIELPQDVAQPVPNGVRVEVRARMPKVGV